MLGRGIDLVLCSVPMKRVKSGTTYQMRLLQKWQDWYPLVTGALALHIALMNPIYETGEWSEPWRGIKEIVISYKHAFCRRQTWDNSSNWHPPRTQLHKPNYVRVPFKLSFCMVHNKVKSVKRNTIYPSLRKRPMWSTYVPSEAQIWPESTAWLWSRHYERRRRW